MKIFFGLFGKQENLEIDIHSPEYKNISDEAYKWLGPFTDNFDNVLKSHAKEYFQQKIRPSVVSLSKKGQNPAQTVSRLKVILSDITKNMQLSVENWDSEVIQIIYEEHLESLASAHSDDPREKYRYLLDNFEKLWRESNGHKFVKFGEDRTKE